MSKDKKARIRYPKRKAGGYVCRGCTKGIMKQQGVSPVGGRPVYRCGYCGVESTWGLKGLPDCDTW